MSRWILALLFLISPSVHAQTLQRTEKTGTAGVSSSARTAAKETWTIDAEHSKLTFSLRLFLGRTQGQFDTWSGVLTVPPDNWNNAAVDVVIQASSINTENSDRDDHLRNSDFFDVEKYPEITFKSTSIKRVGDSISVAGNLTMKGVTKPVVLTGKFMGLTPGQRPRMDFQATTVINRRDYGVSYNRVREGGPMLGDEVTINIVVAAVKNP